MVDLLEAVGSGLALGLLAYAIGALIGLLIGFIFIHANEVY